MLFAAASALIASLGTRLRAALITSLSATYIIIAFIELFHVNEIRLITGASIF